MNTQKEKKRKDLTVLEKVEILEFLKTNPLISQRSLANKFSISLGSINNIIKKSAEIYSFFESNENRNCVRMNRLPTKTHAFDQKLYEWFQNKRARNFLISQENLKGMALKLANKYNVKDFKASDGYINRFRARHKIKSRSVVGEAGIVKTDAIEEFKVFYNLKLLEYEPKNIFNADETGLFWRHNANRTLVVNEHDKASGKFSKERVTILFCVSLEGEKMKPVVIGKAKSPSSFKGKNIDNLNIIYKNNPKAWMNLSIFNEWLDSINDEMISSNRKILLVLDNATVHPIDTEYSNIEIIFFPPNVTSLIQPCDQGIIKNFKDFYKRYLNKKILFELDECLDELENSDVVKKINFYDSMVFIHKAWNDVTEETIKNCFNKALENTNLLLQPRNQETNGIFDEEFPICAELIDDDTQFLDFICVDDEVECFIKEKEVLSHNTVTSIDAYKCLEKAEHWFLNNCAEKLDIILELKDSIIEEKANRPPKITDYLIKKEK